MRPIYERLGIIPPREIPLQENPLEEVAES
jgi:hypothetical protein